MNHTHTIFTGIVICTAALFLSPMHVDAKKNENAQKIIRQAEKKVKNIQKSTKKNKKSSKYTDRTDVQQTSDKLTLAEKWLYRITDKFESDIDELSKFGAAFPSEKSDFIDEIHRYTPAFQSLVSDAVAGSVSSGDMADKRTIIRYLTLKSSVFSAADSYLESQQDSHFENRKAARRAREELQSIIRRVSHTSLSDFQSDGSVFDSYIRQIDELN
jgi:hypothetical protein